jgi:hypothetical protein
MLTLAQARIAALAAVTAVLVVIATLASASAAHAATGRAMPITAAVTTPADVFIVRPHTARTVLMNAQCRTGAFDSTNSNTGATRWVGGSYWTNFNAYRANGRALGVQRYNSDSTVITWAHGVTFDGITVRNRTDKAIMWAGWCD